MTIETQIEDYRNPAFAADDVEKAFHKLFLKYASASSRSNFSMSKADLAEISEARSRVAEIVNRGFDRLEQMAHARRENLAAFDGITVLSLGYDCFSRTVTTRWGIKKSGKLGEKSSPFDLSVHPMPAVEKLIRNDFQGYLDPENLEFSEKRNICMNKRYKVLFNHEVGREYAENDFARLREVYGSRVENFRRIVATAPKIAFVVHLKNGTPSDIASLRGAVDALNTQMGERTSSVVVMNCYYPDSGSAIDDIEESGFHVFSAALPDSKYLWHLPECYMTESGYMFEKFCAEGLGRRIMSDLGD